MSDVAAALNYGALITGIGGGLALFLYGMRKMTESLKVVAGDGMKNLLAKLTTNRFSGALAGTVVTAVVQSSSVTTVMVVGFVSAGLMTFSQSIGVILGANVGTTITAQIIAFKVTKYALVMIAGGFLIEVLAKKNRTRHFGIMLMGLGLLFFGMQLMSDAALPLRTHAPFIDFMQELQDPMMGILTGMAFTALVQSSSATTGIVIVLASQGLITLDAGIALVFGANVGTCITVMLAAIGKPRDAVKAGVAHVIFNLGGVLIFLAFIPVLAEFVRTISPQFGELSGNARLAAEVPRQIANAHTAFNVLNTLIFLGFANHLARLIEIIVPKPKPKAAARGAAMYLHPMYLDQPAVALDQVKREIGRLGDMAIGMSDRALEAVLSSDEMALQELRELDNDVDRLHGEIVSYLGKLSLKELVESQPAQIQAGLGIANYLENIGDVVEVGFVGIGRKRLEHGVALDQEIVDQLRELHRKILSQTRRALRAYLDNDLKSAKKVIKSKKPCRARANRIRQQLAQTLGGVEGADWRAYRLGMDCLLQLRQVHTLTRRIARAVLDLEARLAVDAGGDDDAGAGPAEAKVDTAVDNKSDADAARSA